MTTLIPPDPYVDHPAEPLLTRGVIVMVVTTLLNLAISFRLNLSEDQTILLLTLTGLVAPFLVAWLGRRVVWSPRSVVMLLDDVVEEARNTQLSNDQAQSSRSAKTRHRASE